MSPSQTISLDDSPIAIHAWQGRDLLHGAPTYTYYPAGGLRVSGILPQVPDFY